MKLNKAKINFWIDLAIGLAFLVEAISGFVLWLVLPHAGFQGGRNALVTQTFILSRSTWLWLHDWFAVVMVAGILLHVVLHWRWIVCTVRNIWREAFPAQARPATEQECAS